MKFRKLLAFLSMMFAFLAVIVFAVPTIGDPNLGIDFQGGYEVVYRISQKDDYEIPEATDIAEMIGGRIDIAGVKNPQVNVESVPGSSDIYIRVCVSGKDTSDLAQTLTLIESDAEVTFTDEEGNIKMTGREVLAAEDGATLSFQDGSPVVLLNIIDTSKFYSVTSELSGKPMLAWIGYQEESETYIGDFAAYEGYGTAEQQAAAAKKLIVYATVNEGINSSSAIISGSFTEKEAGQIGKLLSAGSMDFVIERTDVIKVDGSLGSAAFNKSIIAGLIGLIAIIALMIILYKIPGIISSLVLILYTAITLLVFNGIGGEYGPDTIAAIVIGLGMAVDCCIIMFERMNDELYKGRSVKAAYEESTKKSLSSIVDSNITTIIAACALYFFGKRSVKGFATMLLITTVGNVIIMLLATRLLMFLLIRSGLLDNKKHLFGVNEKKIPDIKQGESQTYFGMFGNVKFVKNTKKVMLGYLGVFVAALLALGASFGLGYGNGHGLNFGLDFIDGTEATINFSNVTTFVENSIENPDDGVNFEYFGTVDADDKVINVTKDDVINFLQNGLNYSQLPELDNVSVNSSFDEEGIQTLSITIKYYQSAEEFSQITEFEDDVLTALNLTAINDGDVDYSDYVTISQTTSSPTMALATVTNALLSLAIAAIFIILYIAIRFRFTYALAAICALLIDTLFTCGIMAIFQIKVETAFVSAVLAIIGYSINATVVIFDRVREIAKETNYGHLTEETRYEIVDKAVRDTATRSVWTTVSTLLPILALIFIGDSSTIPFCLAMLAGLISGMFSSMFLAPAIWLKLEKRHMIRLKEKALASANAPKQSNDGPEELTVIGIND